MARKYSKKASADVERAMKKRKAGTLKSGRSGRKVTSRKQAIAIGLSEARAKGKKVPKKASKKRKAAKKASSDVGRAMKKRKAGTLKSGRSGRKVKSRKQAIAIGLSEARAKGKKVPKKASKKRKASKKKAKKSKR